MENYSVINKLEGYKWKPSVGIYSRKYLVSTGRGSDILKKGRVVGRYVTLLVKSSSLSDS